MDTLHLKPLTSAPTPKGSVTNFDWCVGGMTTSEDGGRTYTISVFKPWYVYRHKPKWFGEHSGDRYLGRLRWISRHADGKQWRWVNQHGQCHDWVVTGGTQDENSRRAGQIVMTYGYTAPWHGVAEIRERCIARNYHLGIRCAACRITGGEMHRKLNDARWALMFPPGMGLRGGMDRWDAGVIAREQTVCRCGKPE